MLNGFAFPSRTDDAVPEAPPFKIEIVGMARGPVMPANGLPIEAHRSIDEIGRTDIVIVPSIAAQGPLPGKGPLP